MASRGRDTPSQRTLIRRYSAERKVLDLAMQDYERLRGLGWKPNDLGGLPKKLFVACRTLAAQRRRKK